MLDGDGCVVEAKNLCQKEKDCLIKQKQSFSIMCANYKFYSNFHVISCLGIRDMHWLHSEFFLCIHSSLETFGITDKKQTLRFHLSVEF